MSIQLARTQGTYIMLKKTFLYSSIKSFIQTIMSNLCSYELILDSKQLYNTIENSQNTLKTETIIRTDTKEHI